MQTVRSSLKVVHLAGVFDGRFGLWGTWNHPAGAYYRVSGSKQGSEEGYQTVEVVGGREVVEFHRIKARAKGLL